MEQQQQEGNARHKGKTKVNHAAIDTSDFLPRAETPWKVGAHVSAAGGVENAVVNAASIGANAFALFVKSQRKWTSPPMKDESVREFKKRMKDFGYTSRMVLPHGSYLLNLANPDEDKREKSYECFLDDLKRCEALGLELYNFHPGSTVGATTTEASLGHIADCINRAHKETTVITTVLENMAGAGNIIGGNFAHLAGIIERVEDKSRVGICLDTCHSFAAGYDIHTKEGWNLTSFIFSVTKFEEEVGLKYLRAMHLNDSKTPCNSRKDRHENIGLGHLGLQAFHHVLTNPRTQNIPLILETPTFDNNRAVWGTEIAVLNRLSGSSIRGKVADDVVFDDLTTELKSAIKSVEGKKGGGTRSKAKKIVTKRKGDGNENENDADEEGDSTDDAELEKK
ncbi:xylose isomerase-like protein [Gymnopilus junonius]|uniref:Apurinic-apyrimidinic endonuclease 1 n=1 Tax=Gymnopilus junonius TaxID=109634 RepID=A0A9P5TJ37_GYMJU|nr:xylose isomerase-like protein [Gymnopilus junonius]